jgi:hypothetical protein
LDLEISLIGAKQCNGATVTELLQLLADDGKQVREVRQTLSLEADLVQGLDVLEHLHLLIGPIYHLLMQSGIAQRYRRLIGNSHHKRQVIVLKLAGPETVVQVEDPNSPTLHVKGHAQYGPERVPDNAIRLGQFGIFQSIGGEHRFPFSPDALDDGTAELKRLAIDIRRPEMTTQVHL